MFSRLWPLSIRLLCEDRPYGLGETINVTVEMTARGSVDVCACRLELVCEVRYTYDFTVMVPEGGPRSARLGAARGAPFPPVLVPRRVAEEYKETQVLSSVVFLRDQRPTVGATGRFPVALPVPAEAPSYPEDATVRWALVATADVRWARDVKRTRTVEVLLR